MSSFVDKLKDALNSFKSVKADLDEIRKCKNEVQALRDQLFDTAKYGYYLRDDTRIILSAPEIIIGNVDHTGSLIAGSGSSVVIRGNDAQLQGTGEKGIGGSVTTRAARISQLAVDPGIDGNENIVMDGVSSIVNKAVSITLDTEDSVGAMVNLNPAITAGILLNSETSISLNACPGKKSKTDVIDEQIKALDESISNLTTEVDDEKSNFDIIIDYLSEQAEDSQSLNDSEIHIRTNYKDLAEMNSTYIYAESGICSTLERYSHALSRKAEANRQKEVLKTMKDDLSKKSDFEKKTNNSSISMSSETFYFSSVDGDGNIKENEEAGFFVSTPHLSVISNDKNGALIKDSSLLMNIQKIDLSTANAKYSDDDWSKGDFTSEGDISITTKTFTLQAVDSELKDKKIEEKALTKDSSFKVRAENISMVSTDTEGKSTGEIKVNAKNLQIASMDLDKDKGTDKEMAKGSQMVLLSENMFAGSLDKDNKSKLMQIVSDKVGVMADTTAEMQQGDAKAVVTLDGGNLTAGGSKVELDGDSEIKGKLKVGGDLEAPNGKFKGLDASGKFTSPNISDGMMGGTAGAAGKPSAKMKMEDSKKKQ